MTGDGVTQAQQRLAAAGPQRMATQGMAILVGGGPAPGINGVIAAATLRALQAGVEVLGLPYGFSQLMQGRLQDVRRLRAEDVRDIHFAGGVILGTARANPTHRPADLDQVAQSLRHLGVATLVTVGGDDTAYSAMKLAEHATDLRVVHVPKTIDNDLALPQHIDTFGYQTARHVGAGLVKNLMLDARASARWYFVVAMGRKAGALALGIAHAAGASLALIPEDFGLGRLDLDHIADVLVGAIVKRRAAGGRDGVAVLAEGLAELIPHHELQRLGPVTHDEHGHLRLGDIDLGQGLRRIVEERLQALGLAVSIVAKDIGYELRCADPIAPDIEYTRELGYCAAQFLLDGGAAAMVSIQDGRFVPIPFAALLDPLTGRTRVRTVDVTSLRYAVARRYMTRLLPEDFSDTQRLADLARAAHLDSASFSHRFARLLTVERAPEALAAGNGGPAHLLR